jgi:hypothetical protein
LRNKILFYLFFFFSVQIFAQQSVLDDALYSESEVEICNSKFQLAADKKLSTKPINEVVAAIGKSFVGTDYTANTLDIGKKEKLVLFLVGLDCYTLMESSLAIARCIKAGKTTFEDYEKEILNLRYRDGKLTDYTSRLHYFSDWIFDMNKRGIGKNITKEIGGEKYNLKVDFMSKHPDSYKQLKANPEFVKKIAKIEKEISSRSYFYIPKDKIKSVENKVQSGDVIGITTNIDGLDISHTGIAYRSDDGRIHLLHAPNVGHKVQVSEKTLADYLMGNKKQTGIIVVRPNEP